TERRKNGMSIGGEDLARRPMRVEHEDDGNESFDDKGIAVAGEAQDRLAIVILDMRGDPHLARAALHLVGGRTLAFIEGRQATAKLDDIPVAILPFLEDGKVIGQ